MYISSLGDMDARSFSGSRMFRYEVVGLPQKVTTHTVNYPIRTRGYVFITVPYSRMNQEMRRITRMGGKIVSIRPLTLNGDVNEPGTHELAWWLEISTQQPQCIYYFGPFENAEIAQSSEAGYLEDLQEEKAEGINVQLLWCRPNCLTIF